MIYNTYVVRIHSNKCHLQDNIYNTVIYCNNRGLKFHKKKQNSSAFQCWQHQSILNWEKTLPKLPASHLLLGRTDQSILQRCIPLGVSVFHESRLILPGAASATLAGKNVFGVGCLRVCVFVSASLAYGRLKSVCDLFVLLSVCACVCLVLCEHSVSVCVNVSDRCVGSGLLSCWRCGHARPSLVGRSCLLHSRSAGKAPSRGCLSYGGVYTPDPPSARAYRCETRSAWRSKDPRNSLQIAGKCLPPCLAKGNWMVKQIRSHKLQVSVSLT